MHGPDLLAIDGSCKDGAIGVGVVGVVGGVDVDIAEAAGFGDGLAAECAALARALRASSPAPIEIRCDCRPLLDLVGRATLTPVPALAPTIAALRATIDAHGAVTLVWVPRHRNRAANARARAALGLADKAPRHQR